MKNVSEHLRKEQTEGQRQRKMSKRSLGLLIGTVENAKADPFLASIPF